MYLKGGIQKVRSDGHSVNQGIHDCATPRTHTRMRNQSLKSGPAKTGPAVPDTTEGGFHSFAEEH